LTNFIEMSFLRRKDYYSLIDTDSIDVITDTTSSFLTDREKAAQEEVSSYIRHRYDVKKVFKDVLTYSYSTQYYINDLVEWSETAYSATSTYSLNQRCSYSGNIYKCNTAGTTGVWNASKWDLLAVNETLYYCAINCIGALPSTSFTFTTNAYTTNHDTIKGWDKLSQSTIYLKRRNKEICIYFSAADRNADTNKVGSFEYNQEGMDFPITAQVTPGQDDDNILSGFISIIGYISDLTEWSVVASNYWIEGDNRNQMILQIMIDVVLYHIFSRIQPRNIPDLRKERYDGNDPNQNSGAIGYLKRVQKGTVDLDLPVHNDQERGQVFSFGSETKQNFSY
jgi:hypothetical protein